jgi:predicted short-subunit dehydrogenase-like oxidoreductase (DUF2520 family)
MYVSSKYSLVAVPHNRPMRERDGSVARPGHSHDAGDDEAGDGRPRLAFVGAGSVGSALAVGFARAGWDVAAVASRDAGRRERVARLLPGIRVFAEPQAVLDEADLVFLTVPDDEIARAASGLHLYSGQALVHTSGALPATVLEPARAAGTSLASFHPLVAFADLERALADMSGATVALEGDEPILPLLAELAESLGARAVRLPPSGKAPYHAAAMLAAGGLVGLIDAIAELGRAAGLDERQALAVYLPLCRQAMANAESMGVDRALTGPLLRGDVGTVRSHLAAVRELAPSALPLYLAIARRELEVAARRSGPAPDPGQAERSAAIRRLLDESG